MKHAFIMDPLEAVKTHKDTSYYLMLAACQRGHQVYYLDASNLYVKDSLVMAVAKRVNVQDHPQIPFESESEGSVPMADMDVVWIRTDPPVDLSLIHI